MGRIQDGYRDKLRELLALVRPRRLEFGVELLMARARALAEGEGLGAGEALGRLYEFTRWRVHRRLEATGACALLPRETLPQPVRFACDGSLGGLARWLRAAGYRADVLAGAADAGLVDAAAAHGGVLATTDAEAARLARRRTVAVQWVPSGLEPVRQMGMVLRDLGLAPCAPRCMACGGSVRAVAKDAVRDRIPPRTALWKDDYFVCDGCGLLLWQGTHWERIQARLDAERPSPAMIPAP